MQQAGSCATCLKPIADKQWVTGESKKEYHSACFSCAECKAPVAPNTKYFEIPSPSARVGSIVRCAKCQANYNCAVCKGTIAVLVHKKFEGKLYHTDCASSSPPFLLRVFLIFLCARLAVRLVQRITEQDAGDARRAALLSRVRGQGLSRRVRPVQKGLSRRLHRGPQAAVARGLPDLLQVRGRLSRRTVLRQGRPARLQAARPVSA